VLKKIRVNNMFVKRIKTVFDSCEKVAVSVLAVTNVIILILPKSTVLLC